MVHASLFSGIGGPEVAAAMLGWENAFHCEINPFGRRVLDYWFPESKSYEDITKTSFKEWRGKVDVLTGGFPCQPFSLAGKRGGANDNRYLWPEMLRVITEVRPTWVIGENVAGITTMVESVKTIHLGHEKPLFAEDGDEAEVYCEQSEFTIERICRDLEHAGYTVQPVLIPACAVGAPHRRDRIFFLAHIDNPIGNGDCEHSRTAGQEKGEERLPERNGVRKSCKSSALRPENGATIEDSICVGRGFGELEEQGCIRNEWNISTGNAERIHCEKGTDIADTESNGGRDLPSDSLRPRTDGEAERISGNVNRLGRVRSSADTDSNGCASQEENYRTQGNGSQADAVTEERGFSSKRTDGLPGVPRNVPDSDCERFQESLSDGRSTERKEKAAGQNDRVERPDTCVDAKLPTNSEHTDVEQLCEEFRICQRENSYLSRVRGSLLPENRWRTFPTVSPVYRGNDGLPFSVDDLTIPFGRWKTESLKAYGNAIVVQVMYEIFRAIESVTNK